MNGVKAWSLTLGLSALRAQLGGYPANLTALRESGEGESSTGVAPSRFHHTRFRVGSLVMRGSYEESTRMRVNTRSSKRNGPLVLGFTGGKACS